MSTFVAAMVMAESDSFDHSSTSSVSEASGLFGLQSFNLEFGTCFPFITYILLRLGLETLLNAECKRVVKLILYFFFFRRSGSLRVF